jgi:hypothetical protein
MVTGGVSEYGLLLDVGVLTITAVVLMLIGGRLYARVGR